MNAFERQRLLAALLLLVIALFVAAGYPPALPWRRRLRFAALVAFGLAVAAALVEIGLWLSGGRP